MHIIYHAYAYNRYVLSKQEVNMKYETGYGHVKPYGVADHLRKSQVISHKRESRH